MDCSIPRSNGPGSPPHLAIALAVSRLESFAGAAASRKLGAFGGADKFKDEMRRVADAHAEEVVVAWEAWRAECRAADERAGLPEAERKHDELSAEWHAAARLVATARARTVDGLLAKLTGLKKYYPTDEEIGEYPVKQDATADGILESAVRDAAALT